MKNTIILVVLLTLATAGVYYFLVYKKKKNAIKIDPITPPNSNPVRPPVQSDEKVRVLQKHLNSILPAGYPKLVEDGIWGPKTQAAVELMDKKADNGELTDADKDKTKSIIDIAYDLSGVSDLQDLRNGFVKTVGGIVKKKADALKAGFDKIFG